MGGAALRVLGTLVHHIAARIFSPLRWLAESSQVYLMAPFSTKLQQLLMICVTSLYSSWFMGFLPQAAVWPRPRNEMEGRSVLLTSRGKSSRPHGSLTGDDDPRWIWTLVLPCLSPGTREHGYPVDADAA
ncbi:hypothetical protein B0J15DRAFT_219840 [Fusarium solani]|uniref:Uncharacterized protein n=1 Tax=Fusarium solani TaxID=169388 RepID=A0A9P9RB30_FUSSL|nr:uncharacterized protein B0J15DRAFT_219840 [Fusarium solani]KAH7271585.1 hypothetical protein B0J15DRAFT_219840 [Fusarium solani]